MSIWAQFAEIFRSLPDLPDLIAWRLDAWTVRVDDQRLLSPDVRDAYWGVRR